ncbi:unnamed protein product [Rotaria magnacalcarata]|uniref:SAM domain-containing protein n=3 Tax=Rotaria magnacalcarata TaxID=392030 RepID=A0A819JN75_9BILA|nr:unnamed protein product [Rotaria magnacalcarata]CAF2064344.1 unnamed protein product [Rotaria magnacalcarata]CAF3769019.1 unnamed protein product [Rotaria magnacalcarata]CAF3933299.1 unnamed protein product [Rotaria magnacalcarata]
MMSFTNTNNDYLSQAIISSETNQLENVPLSPSLTKFHTSQVTTDDIPLNIARIQHSQTVTTISVPLTKTLRIRQDQNLSRRKPNANVTTHIIAGWKIQESLEPFQQQENKSSSSKTQEWNITSGNLNVQQWSIDQVCSFFEYTLGRNSYASIIKEHLIDGIVLLLLKDEHLSNTFQMPLEHRQILLKKIRELKNGDLSLL